MRKTVTLLLICYCMSSLVWADQTLTYVSNSQMCSYPLITPLLQADFYNSATGCHQYPQKWGSSGHGDICINATFANDLGIKGTCNSQCCCYWDWYVHSTVTAKDDCSALTGQPFQKALSPWCTY
jgi:hypothetical protein